MLALGLGSFGDDDDFVIAMFVISCLEMGWRVVMSLLILNMFCILHAFAFFDI